MYLCAIINETHIVLKEKGRCSYAAGKRENT